MPIEVIEDLLDDQSGSRTDKGIEGLRRSFLVTGLDVTSAPSRIRRALGDSRVPQRGDPHPRIRTSVVDRVDAAMLDPTKARLSVTYAPVTAYVPDVDPTPSATARPSLSVSSTLQTIETNFDKDGKLLVVKYIVPLPAGQAGPPEEIEQVATASIQIPMVTFSYSRDEVVSHEEIQAKANTYVGLVNSVQVFGDPERTWMCMSISGASTNPDIGTSQTLPLGQPVFNVQYEFQRSEPGQTWDTSRRFLIVQDGKPPKDVTVGNGILTDVKFYEAIDFNGLNLTT